MNYTAVGFWGNKWKRVRGRERERSSVPMGDSQCPKSTVTDRNFSSSFLFSFADARQEFVFGREQQQRLLVGPALGNTLSRKYVDTRREHYRGFGKQDEDACRLLPRALLDTSHGYLCFCEWRVRLRRLAAVGTDHRRNKGESEAFNGRGIRFLGSWFGLTSLVVCFNSDDLSFLVFFSAIA